MIHVAADAEGAALAAARVVRTVLRGHARDSDGLSSLVLSGGTTPERLYRHLADTGGEGVRWERVQVLWGDERCVPPDDERSNYGLAVRSGLLGRRVAAVWRMPGESPPDEGAAAYERDLARALAQAGRSGLDLVVLGLGEDGHTASLLPGSAVLQERERLVAATEPYDGTRRLTLTLPALLSACVLLFLVTGEAKAEAVRRVLEGGTSAEAGVVPARLLVDLVGEAVARKGRRRGPRCVWVLDQAAASGVAALRGRLDGDWARA